jgi:hypothetical protein
MEWRRSWPKCLEESAVYLDAIAVIGVMGVRQGKFSGSDLLFERVFRSRRWIKPDVLAGEE